MIAIIDYGAGNLRSVECGFARIGAATCVTRDAAEIAAADGLILPGVGAFADAMAALTASGLIPAIRAYAAGGRPLLGICLGMQMLFESSEEGPGADGLGLVPGVVRRLPDCGLKIPHIGWNTITPAKPSSLLAEACADGDPYVYFVHSYACACADPADVLTTTAYGTTFHSAVQRGNVIGMQFHPEKSGAVGKQLLRAFVELTEGGRG